MHIQKQVNLSYFSPLTIKETLKVILYLEDKLSHGDPMAAESLHSVVTDGNPHTAPFLAEPAKTPNSHR